MDINNREFITGPLFIFLMVSGVFPGHQLPDEDAAEGGALRVHYGEFYQDEQSYKVEGNIGLPLGANGFHQCESGILR